MSRGRGRGDFGQKRTLPGDVMQRIQADDSKPREDRLYPPRSLHLPSVTSGTQVDYRVNLKSRFRCWFRSSPYFNPRQYTERRKLGETVHPGFNPSGSNLDQVGPRSHCKDDWQPNWKIFPTELNWRAKRVRRDKQAAVLGLSHLATAEEVDRLITDLADQGGIVIDESVPLPGTTVPIKNEKVEDNGPDQPAPSDDEDDDAGWKDLEAEDEEDDIDNDYMDTYFDNGEDNAAEYDDGEEREPNYD